MLEDITADAESDDDEDEENDTHIRKTDVDMFIKALDKDGDGMVGQTEFLDYMLRGMSMTEAERKKFAKRSTMHGKLNRFVDLVVELIVDLDFSFFVDLESFFVDLVVDLIVYLIVDLDRLPVSLTSIVFR